MKNGQNIRLLRQERGLSLTELARQASLSPSYLSEVEHGNKNPSLKVYERLAAVLDVPVNQLVDLSDLPDGLQIGDKLRLLREKKNLSLTETAKEAGISTSYLSEIEHNRVVPAVATITNLAAVLEIPVRTLLSSDRLIGPKIRQIRKEQGWTQSQLAEKAGISPGLIGQIEQGKAQPSLATVQKIAQAAGVSPCYFVTDGEGFDDIWSALSPDLRELLMEDNVQALLRQICTLDRRDLQFILDFIRLYRTSR